MEQIKEITKNKELIVRKKIVNFFEKILRHLNYDFSHDRFKGIVYSEISPETPLEEKVKIYFDALIFLLNNKKIPMTNSFLSRFFYLILGREMEKNILIRIKSYYFFLTDYAPLEKAIEFHLFVYQELKDLSEEQKFIISLFFLNFCLVACDIPCIRLLNEELKEYKIKRKQFFDGDKNSIYIFLLNILKNSKYQDITYYKELEPISLQEISDFIKNHKRHIMNKFKVKHLFIFGSFAKRTNRIDSDIDILINFSLDLLYEEKLELKCSLETYLFEKFHRFIDIHEIFEYLTDDLIKETTKIKKIF